MDNHMKAVPRIGVLGPHDCTDADMATGKEVGRAVARAGAVLLCGGLDGMMTAAAQGAHDAGGQTVGILPGHTDMEANPFINIPVPTGLGPFRNMLLVRACHAVIAVRGGYGTLSEIAFALRLSIPVIGLQTWELSRNGQIDPGIHRADSPQQAVQLALHHMNLPSPA